MNAQTIQLNIKAISDFSDIQNNVKNVQNVINQLKIPDKLKSSFSNTFSDLEKEMKKYQKYLDSGFKTKGDITGLEKSSNTISKLLDKLNADFNKINPDILKESFNVDTSKLDEATKKVKDLQAQMAQAMKSNDMVNSIEQVNNAIKGLSTKSKFADQFKQAFAAGDIQAASRALEQLVANHKKLKDNKLESAWDFKEPTSAINVLKTALEGLSSNQGLVGLNDQAKIARQELLNLGQTEFNKFVGEIDKGKVGLEQASQGAKNYFGNIQQAAQGQQKFNNEMDMLKSRAAYFFGLANSIQLFKRALRSAFNTVKELDKAMTEIAVVTDFDISDMWDKLPEFADQANKLGVSLKSAYEATTLFVQQGLNFNDSMELSAETLKMARIAGMEAAEATDAMTAALRGFNMELDSTSGQRINDVYSELAANTASNVQEISTAMTKTASIASSAGMEFETTAAFLSQIIETTREAPETAGTALKTVIARFQELKKAPSEIGEVDGEIVDANKVEAALNTIGVALRDSEGQFRNLDDVFLEIAGKWDALDTNTQRYIATMAAGSRQQSRFIAMMSDYDRTMELVSMANNSAGASQEQFEKTTKSLESKLAKLKNAWDEFTMGIADNGLIKAGIDALTLLLNTINKITEVLPGTSGGIAKLALSFGVLRVGANVIPSLLGKFVIQTKNAAAASAAMAASNLKMKALFSRKFWAATIPPTAEIQSAYKAMTVARATYAQRSAGLEKWIASQTAESMALESTRSAVSAAQNMIEKEKIALNQALAASYKELGFTEQEITALEGINLTQDELSLVMSNAQVRQNLIEALSKKGLTEAEKEQIVVEELHNKTRGKGLAATLAYTVAAARAAFGVKFQTGALGGLITAEMAETTAKGGMTAAQTLFNAALSACPLMWIVAGIVAIVGIAKLYDKVTETNAEKQERLNKEYENAKKVSDELKESYSSLLSAKDEYDERRKGLADMVKGTKEWKQALLEANNQVLKLVENYDGLIVKRDANTGELIVENFDQVLEDQYKASQNAQLATAFSNQAKVKNEIESRNVDEFDQYFSFHSLYDEDREKILDLVRQGKGNDEEALKAAGLERLVGADAQGKLEQYLQINLPLDSELANVSSVLASSINLNAADSKYSDVVADSVANWNNRNYDEITENIELKLPNTVQGLKDKYKELTGKEASEDWSDSELENQVVNLMRAQLATDKTEKIIQLLEDADKGSAEEQENAAAIAGYLSGGLTLKKDQKLKLDKNSALAQEIAIELDVTVDEIIASVEEINANNEEAFTKARTQAEDSGVNSITAGVSDSILTENGATLQQVQGYMDQLTQLFGNAAVKGGETAGIKAGNWFNSLLKDTLKLADTDQVKEQILNIFSTADLTTESGIQDFFTTLESIGVVIPLEQQNDYIEQLRQLVDVYNDLDLKKVINQAKELNKLADEIAEKEDFKITSEQYAQIIEGNAADSSEFFWNGQDYIYLGNTMEDLASAIRQNTSELIKRTIAEKEEQIAVGNDFAKMLENPDLSTDLVAYFQRDRDLIESGSYDNVTVLRDLLGMESPNFSDAEVLAEYRRLSRSYLDKDTTSAEIVEYKGRVRQAELYEKGSAVDIWNSNRILYSEEERRAAIEALRKDPEIASLYKNMVAKHKEHGAAYDIFADTVFTDLAIAINEANKAQSTLNKTLSEGKDILNEENKNTQKYLKLRQEIITKANKLYNGVIDEEFFETHLSLFKTIAEGGEEAIAAYEDLNKLAAKALLLEINPDIKNPDGIVAEILSLIPSNLEYGETFDPSNIFNKGTVYGLSKEEISEILNQLGYNVKTFEAFDNTYYDLAAKRELDPDFDLLKDDDNKDKDKDWENPYDKQYNILEEINEEIRRRELLEKELQKIQADAITTPNKLLETYGKINASLERELDLKEKLKKARIEELKDYLIENSGLSDYAKYIWEEQRIEIDWELINGATPEEGEKIEKYISGLEKIVESLESIDSDILDIKDEQINLVKEMSDSYLSFEERLASALETNAQKEIDMLQDEFDALTDAENALADSISNSIDEMRQARDNEKTEEEISEKERRLAYLRQDTTGANVLEVKKLEEEIAEQRENYQDALVDQALTNLQDQNEAAAEQRERQIAIMQSQLDYNVESGVYAKQAADMIAAVKDGDNILTKSEEGIAILNQITNAENWVGLSTEAYRTKWRELLSEFNAAKTYESLKQYSSDYMAQMVKLYKENGEITDEIRLLNLLRNEKIWSGQGGKQTVITNITDLEEILKGHVNKQNAGLSTNPPTNPQTNPPTEPTEPSTVITKVSSTGAEIPRYHNVVAGDTLSGIASRYETTVAELLKLNPEIKNPDLIHTGQRIKIYKTGGLADFTGPAWLDGTKTKPELVLNAKDTENFIILKDVLSSVLQGSTGAKSNGGDNYFDIDIQVDEIANDYDVDQMIERVKQTIYEDSTYRNVNTVNFLR